MPRRALLPLVGLLAACAFAGKIQGDIETERKRCMRALGYAPARKPHDLNATFAPLLNGEAYAELAPKVLSTDPWIVYFEKFMTEEEVKAIESNMFTSNAANFMPSPAGTDGGRMSARHSETAFCTGRCDAHATVQSLRKRAGGIVHVPPENFDYSQSLRYKEGMYYHEHHDNHPTFHYGPSGARIFTYFVYLSDEGLEGGATYFPKLGVTAPAKRGAAVVFVNTKDRNPMETDPRTSHESLVVHKGEKRGMNMWLYQYNYKDFFAKSCATIELSDALGDYGKSAAPNQQKVIFTNNAKRELHVWEILDRRPHVYRGSVMPGSHFEVDTVEGNLMHVTSAKNNGKIVLEYPVKNAATQRVSLGKKPKNEL